MDSYSYLKHFNNNLLRLKERLLHDRNKILNYIKDNYIKKMYSFYFIHEVNSLGKTLERGIYKQFHYINNENKLNYIIKLLNSNDDDNSILAYEMLKNIDKKLTHIENMKENKNYLKNKYKKNLKYEYTKHIKSW